MFHWSMIIWKILLSWLVAQTSRLQLCSMKTNIGNAIETSGIASLIKTLHSIRQTVWKLKKLWCHEGYGRLCFLIAGFMIHHVWLWIDVTKSSDDVFLGLSPSGGALYVPTTTWISWIHIWICPIARPAGTFWLLMDWYLFWEGQMFGKVSCSMNFVECGSVYSIRLYIV